MCVKHSAVTVVCCREMNLLLRLTVSVHILLCPAWASSHQPFMDSIFSAQTGKTTPTLCWSSLTVTASLSPPAFLPGLNLQDDPLRFDPCCLTSPLPPPLFPPPPQLWKRGNPVGPASVLYSECSPVSPIPTLLMPILSGLLSVCKGY